MDIAIKIFAFTFGAMVGSFLNVLIYRLPRNQSIVLPRSHCPHCQKTIVWYENIPLLSFIFLKGRCRGCSSKISWRYFLIEFAAGFVALALAPRSLDLVPILLFLFLFSVFCVFLVHFFIDIEHQILPDSLNIYLALAFLSYAIFYLPWGHWVWGAVVGAGLPLLVVWLFYMLKGQIGLGGGDIKLYGALGIYLGPVGIIHNIFLSCFLGSLVGFFLIFVKKMSKEHPMPFGPFIIIAASLQIFFPRHFSNLLFFWN